jgi:predicted nucleotidyltransferase
MIEGVGSVQERFAAALDALVNDLRGDRSILAAVLCGSLSHDTVWAKSDIDLVLVTVDDRTAESAGVALYADGLNAHVFRLPRAAFRKLVEGSVHNSFMHSLLAKGRLLYSHDPTIADLYTRVADIGARDAAIQLLGAATDALSSIDKAHKWFITRGDLDYTALWLLYAATPLAQVEVISARRLVDREVILHALALNRPFFTTIYVDLLNTKKTRKNVQAALDAVDNYMTSRSDTLFALVFDYLRDAREPRSSTEIEAHFKRHFDIAGVTTACEYLADRKRIGKVSTPVRLTRRSNVDLQELAFVDISST